MDLRPRQQLVEKQIELIKVVEAIDSVLRTKEWQLLDELVWSKRANALEKDLLLASKEDLVDVPNIYRLQGRLQEAKRFADLKGFGEERVRELEAIKLKIK